MLEKEKVVIYAKAIAYWGNDLQMLMCIEEMSELTKEIVKCIRKKSDFEKIAEEIADVEVMLEQLKFMFNNKSEVEKYIQQKLEKVREMLK